MSEVEWLSEYVHLQIKIHASAALLSRIIKTCNVNLTINPTDASWSANQLIGIKSSRPHFIDSHVTASCNHSSRTSRFQFVNDVL
jgi:hypothetical protein